MVISHTAAFSPLVVDPIAAVRNLRRLRDIGAYGRWGYIEALDFTPGRCRRADRRTGALLHGAPCQHEPARRSERGGRRLCAEAVHGRCVNGGVHPAATGEAAGFECRDAAGQLPVPERPRQHDKSRWELRGSEANAGAHACLLSNGAYSIRVTDDGNSAAFFRRLLRI